MFLDQAFETAQEKGVTILECSPVEEAKMRNHTCVCERFFLASEEAWS